MSTAINAESLAVAVIVLAFVLRALFQLFPAASRRGVARLRAAIGLEAGASAAAAADCDSGCGSCNGCGSVRTPARTVEAPIEFQPKLPRR